MIEAVRVLLEEIGEDPNRDGLQRTPLRYAKALKELTVGYGANMEKLVNKAMFEEGHKEMVLVRNIAFHSLCEHHVLPFYGVAHVAYLPEGNVIGISKVARIVEAFSRRLQVQERLGTQIGEALAEAANARGVAVAIEATHMCMTMRGVRAPGSATVTTCLRGAFAEDDALRKEFMGFVTATTRTGL